MIRSLSRFAITSYIRNGNWSNYASLPNRLVQAKRLFVYPGIRQFYLDVQLNGKPQLHHFSKSMLALVFPQSPPSTCQHWSTIFLSERKKKYMSPPHQPWFLYEEKTTHFQTATSCTYAPGGVLKPVPLKSDPPGKFMTGSLHPVVWDAKGTLK